ncbi:hypothetical protein PF008_g30915 [Phytophthora fragariae]|uniref:Uncharacterized protein n=1 Tax=Phytophthora fragariae TaxID=53985 RepID=A0A6G0Q4Y9_9STRA|nr:hypothetical protein PF008_g30915 [Phytophthora fragariae]
MTAKFNYTDEAQMQTRATQLPPASAGRVHCHLAHADEDSIMNGYVPGSRVRVNLVIEYVADKKSGHDVVCFIKHVSALTPLVNEYSNVDML